MQAIAAMAGIIRAFVWLMYYVCMDTNQRTLPAIAILMLVIGLAIGYAAATPNDSHNPAAHMMPDGTLMSANIDQHFIVQMIPHHEGAIEMANVALEKSKRPEVLALARGIIEAQTREISDMTTWYQNWYGTTPPEGGMHGEGGMGGQAMHMDGMTGDMEELKAAPIDQFDRIFLEQMIPHHEMAVMMADMLKAGSERKEMTTLADQIISSQASEIEMMRGWLKEWY